MTSAQVFATIWAGGVSILGLGVIWFFVARPILVDYGIVKDYDPRELDVMSRSEDRAAPSIPSSPETTGLQTPDQTGDPAARRQRMLDIYRPLRRLGMTRDEARDFLRLLDFPLDNNAWAAAAPPPAAHLTPIAGRATSAQFDTDAELRYQPMEPR